MARRAATSSLSPPRRLLVLALLGLAGAAPAWAADPAEDARVAEAEALVARVRALGEAGAKDEVEAALPRLVTLHNEMRSGTARTAVLEALGDLLGQEALGGARLAVAEAFGRVKDPDGAWKVLKRFLPSVKEEACGPLPLKVVQSVGLLAPDAALRDLRRLMDDARDANVARHAIEALGHYGWSRHRVRVLEDLIDTLRKLRPGRARGSDRGGEAARARYLFLRESLVAALDRLTGQKIADADKWLQTAQEHRKHLAGLFTYER